MKLIEISVEEYADLLKRYPQKNFLQSSFEAKKMKHDGWEVSCMKVEENGQTKAVFLLTFLPLVKLFRYAYIPRGILEDLNDPVNRELLTRELKTLLKKKRVIYLETDPYILMQERDHDGNIVEGGEKHLNYVEDMKKIGYIHLTPKQGYTPEKQCRWMSVLGLRNKTKEQVFQKFLYQTRQDVRRSEKYAIKIRFLGKDELHILDTMERDTSERRQFEAMSMDYYQAMFEYFGEERIKVAYAYLDLNEYHQFLVSELHTLEADRKEVEEFLKEHPTSTKKIKRLKTLDEYQTSLEKKRRQIQSFLDEGKQELALACSLFILYGSEIVYLVGASDYQYREFKGPYAVQWHMIQMAIEQGYDSYNFYGISGFFEPGQDGYGVFDFKRGFNAKVVELVGNFIYPVHPLLFRLYNAWKKVVY